MHRLIKSIAQQTALLVGALILSSCTPKDATQTQTGWEESERRIQTQLRELEKKINAQNETLTRFEQTATEAVDKKVTTIGQSLGEMFTKLEGDVKIQITSLRQSFLGEKTAVLEPGAKGYSSLTTDKGIFLFAVDGAEPFLDGHKILLRVGNPMNMTFSGSKLKVRYGRRQPVLPTLDISDTATKAVFEKWSADYQNWQKAVRKTEVSFTDSLAPGAWTKIDFALKETKPEDVAYLEVGIETDQILLRKSLQDLK